MTKYAVVDNEIVENVILAEEGFEIEGKVLVPFGEGCAIGGTYANGIFTPPELPEPPVVIPDKVSPRQFSTMLYNLGLLATVENWIDAQDPRVRIAYDKSTYFYRNQEMMTQGFAALGFTEQQIDNFFIEADKL